MGLVKAKPDKMLPWLLSRPKKESAAHSEAQRLRIALWSLTRAVGRDEHSDLLPAVTRECKSECANESRRVTRCPRNHFSWLMPKKFRLIICSV